MDVGAGGGYFWLAAATALWLTTSLVRNGVICNSYNLEDMMGQFGIVPIPIADQ